MSIPDPQLEKVGLSNITTAAYAEVREVIIRRLTFLKLARNKLYMESMQPRPGCFGYCRRFFRKDGSYAQVGLEGELDPAKMKQVLIDDAHTRAAAQFSRKMLTEPGKAQWARTTNELWAFKNLLVDKLSPGQKSYSLPDRSYTEYIFNLFANPDCCGERDESVKISVYDVSILARYLLLKTKPEKLEEVIAVLDPKKTGAITFDQFYKFVSSGELQKHGVILRGCRQFIRNAKYSLLAVLCMRFRDDSKLSILIRTRQECRLRAEIQHTLLESMLSMTEQELIRYFEINGALPGQDSDGSDHLNKLIEANKRSDHRLICRIAQDEAERDFRPKLSRSLKGRTMVTREAMLLSKSKQLSAGYGHCIPSSSASSGSSNSPLNDDWTQLILPCDADVIGRHLYVKNLVCTFDTDCSSSFDQDEISFLFQCLGVYLDEKKILYHFPEVRSGSVEFRRVIEYLTAAGRLKWRLSRPALLDSGHRVPAYVSGAMVGSTGALARKILLAKCRQQAKERTEEAEELAVRGEISPKDRTAGLISGCLLFRVQMLAMRQVDLFMRTVHGKFQRFLVANQLKDMWREYVANSQFSRMGVILYTVDLHSEVRGPTKEKLILASEFPQIVKFLDAVFSIPIIEGKLGVLAETIGTGLRLNPIRALGVGGDKLTWIPFRSAVNILDELLAESKLSWLSSRSAKMFSSDAEWSINSKARQQACILAVNEMGFKVVSTSYRCRILAVERTLDERRNTPVNVPAEMYADVIPKECSLLYLLWHGYNFEDIMFDLENEEIINFTHWDGQISREHVSTKLSVKDAESAYLKKKSSKALLWARTNLVPRLGLRRKFKQYLSAIVRDEDLLEKWAFDFSKELLTGVSTM
jgi:hypothetical protein